jgi:hypothetical protein
MMVPLSVSPLAVLTVSPRALIVRANMIEQAPRAARRPVSRDEGMLGEVVIE